MSPTLLSPSEAAGRMLHHCKQCQREFYIRFREGNNIFTDSIFYRAQCPYCSVWNYVHSPASPASAQAAKAEKEKIERAGMDFRSRPVFDQQTNGFRKTPRPIKKRRGRHLLNRLSFLTKRPWLIRASAAVLLFGLLAFGLLFGSLQYYPSLYLSREPLTYLVRMQKNQPNRIVDRKGDLIAELFSVKIDDLKAHDIPKDIKTLLVFIEDQHFYEHGGIHWPSILRAALTNLSSLSYKQGGSTITQQLARILLSERQKTFRRKFREAALSYALERKLSKEEILAAYLNFVYLGHGAYGIGNAARFYFEKGLEELNFSEQLILSCLPSAPERYSPLRHSQGLQAKLKAVTLRMEREGFHLPQNYTEEIRTVLTTLSRSPSANVYDSRIDHAPYTTEYIRQKIKAILGKQYMYNAGLTIQTSIDLALQRASVQASREFIAQNSFAYLPTHLKTSGGVENARQERLRKQTAQADLALFLMGLPEIGIRRPRLQTASIGIENKTGRVLFLQGGTEFGVNNQLNRAIQMRRQTGSAIKPIVYALAIESGALTTATLLDDRPIFEYKKPKTKSDKDYWTPANYSGVYEGRISVRKALALSQNLPAIRVARLLGMKNLQAGFARFFFPDPKELAARFRADDTIAIGSLEMSPMEMALAYSAFGNNGRIQRPILILSIRDAEGQKLYAGGEGDEFGLNIPPARQVLSGDTAEILVDLLRSAARRGGVARGGYKRADFIGKTGTSNQYRDAWFVGLTPEITTAVWMGFDDPSFSMQGGTGSRLAGPLWGRIMSQAPPVKKKKFTFSPRAKALRVCPANGALYTADCPLAAQRELFRRKYKAKRLTQKTPPHQSTRSDTLLNAASDF